MHVGFTCPPHRQRWFSMLPSASGAWIAHGIRYSLGEYVGFSFLFVFPMILTNPSIYVCSCPAIVLLCDSMVTMFLPTTTCRSHSYVSSDYLVLLCFIRVSATYSHTERWYFAFLFRAGAHFGFCLFLDGPPRNGWIFKCSHHRIWQCRSVFPRWVIKKTL